MKRSKLLTEEDARDMLREAIAHHGGQSAFAEKYKISRIYICKILSGERAAGSKICAVLGLRRVTLYSHKE